jgi:hypothetical protein
MGGESLCYQKKRKNGGREMNLYLIARPKSGLREADMYTCAMSYSLGTVVAAESEDEARQIHPHGEDFKDEEKYYETEETPTEPEWILPKDVVVTLIGVAREGTKPGVILESFVDG